MQALSTSTFRCFDYHRHRFYRVLLHSVSNHRVSNISVRDGFWA
ncbi:unnamed protein product, partial [Vitis vinifera]|uniref:Uncharacterized protein n=1 Tax=Vitis vinifera TaxID=29760 RepID=D7T1Z4_VITVI